MNEEIGQKSTSSICRSQFLQRTTFNHIQEELFPRKNFTIDYKFFFGYRIRYLCRVWPDIVWTARIVQHLSI